jgi:CspA family cold shock protein
LVGDTDALVSFLSRLYRGLLLDHPFRCRFSPRPQAAHRLDAPLADSRAAHRNKFIHSRPGRFFETIALSGLGRKPMRQDIDLIRDRNFRQSRRREFDDDGYEPHLREFGASPRYSTPRFETPSGPPVRAVVKWFKPERGFGFVELADGSGDAFLHASVLERNGVNAVQPGETLEVRVAPGQKGPQVTEVISVDSSTAAPSARRTPFSPADRGLSETVVEEVGTVKWFNAQKGFGFIVREGGGKDAFVHASVLERSGIGSLSEGQRVVIDIAEGRKGPEAVKVRLA